MPDKNQLLDYLRGNCSDEESIAIEKWIAEDTAHQTKLEEVLLEFGEIKADRAAVRQRVMESILKDSRRATLKGRSVFMQTAMKIAASILFLITFAFILYKTNSLFSTGQRSQEIAAGSQQRYDTWLEDSSHVVLNKLSSLKMPLHFDGNRRDVELSGEAFFAVHRDEARPFVIQADKVQVAVLGTSFNVRSYADEALVIVTVASGSVRVTSVVNGRQLKDIILTKGQQAIVDKATGVIINNRVDPEEAIAWKDGFIRFHDQPLDHVLKNLELIYNVRIYADSTTDLTQRVTLNQKATDIESTMKVISAIAGIDYLVAGDLVNVGAGMKEAR